MAREIPEKKRSKVEPLVTWRLNYLELEKKKRAKKVKFSGKVKTEFISMDPDSVAARKGDWHFIAVDRRRFELRIEKINKNIGYIFDREHRFIQYSLRFYPKLIKDIN